MKKRVLTKKLTVFYKISIVLGLLAFSMIFFLPLFFNEDVGLVVYCVLLALGCLFGLVVLLYPFIFIDSNNIMSPITKAKKYKAKVSSFEDFLKTTEDVIEKNEFSKIEKRLFENYDMYLYATPLKCSKLDLILVIRTDVLTNEVVEKSNQAYIECLESHYNKPIKTISNHITIMTIICVNRINSSFRNVVNSNVEQDFGIGRFIAGLSFGGKGLYIAEQVGGFAILKYKKYRKKFFELFEFLIQQ